MTYFCGSKLLTVEQLNSRVVPSINSIWRVLSINVSQVGTEVGYYCIEKKRKLF